MNLYVSEEKHALKYLENTKTWTKRIAYDVERELRCCSPKTMSFPILKVVPDLLICSIGTDGKKYSFTVHINEMFLFTVYNIQFTSRNAKLICFVLY